MDYSCNSRDYRRSIIARDLCRVNDMSYTTHFGFNVVRDGWGKASFGYTSSSKMSPPKYNARTAPDIIPNIAGKCRVVIILN